MPSNLPFYEENALAYAESTREVNMREVHLKFVMLLPPKARVVDAGCGSGRDALAFAQMGYAVDAFDGSAELTKLATELLRVPVQHLRFSEFNQPESYDGVWACSSLVHLNDNELIEALAQLAGSLKPNGVLYTNFKVGSKAYVDIQGRYNNPKDEKAAVSLLEALQLTIVECWRTPHVLDPTQQWVNILAKRPQ
jgi:SAM-dependent methyltransferase